jgi:hypothetical protein
MAQAVSRQPLKSKAWIRARVSPYGISDEQSGTETDFSHSSSVSSVTIVPPWFSTLIFHLEDKQ